MKSLLSTKDELVKKRYQDRMAHLVAFLGLPNEIFEYSFKDNSVLSIIEFKKFGRWTYVTNGLSEHNQPNQDGDSTIELMCVTKKRNKSALELLLKVSEYPFDHGEDICVWDTIPAPINQIGFSKMYSGVILTPLVFEPEEFEFFGINGNVSRNFLIQGITANEMEHAIENGGQGIGEKILKLHSPWLDKERKEQI